MRSGKAVVIAVASGRRQPRRVTLNPPLAVPGRLGLEVRPLTAGEREHAGVNAGLLVREASGHAAEAGLQAGDIVLSVDGTPVKSAQQMHSIVVNEHAKDVALLIQRGHERVFIPVELG